MEEWHLNPKSSIGSSHPSENPNSIVNNIPQPYQIIARMRVLATVVSCSLLNLLAV